MWIWLTHYKSLCHLLHVDDWHTMDLCPLLHVNMSVTLWIALSVISRRNIKLSEFLYNRNKLAQSCSQSNLVIVSQSLSFTDSIRHYYLKLRQDISLCWQSKMFVCSYFTLNYLRFLEYTAIKFIGPFDLWHDNDLKLYGGFFRGDGGWEGTAVSLKL